MTEHNILFAAPPEEVAVNGKKYRINADYRVFVRFELLMQDKSVADADKLTRSLDEFYRGNIPADVEAAANEMLKIYTRGKSAKQSDGKNTSKHGDKMIYSYEYDGDMIYAAFVQCYGVNPADVNMHWWIFKALFDNLPSDCEFMRAVSYRSLKIDGKLPADEKKRLRKLKEFYALPDNRTAEEKEHDFANDFAALF